MAQKTIAVGDRVRCRLFNTPDNQFYGTVFIGTVLQIFAGEQKPYLVRRENLPDIRLHAKEIFGKV